MTRGVASLGLLLVIAIIFVRVLPNQAQTIITATAMIAGVIVGAMIGTALTAGRQQTARRYAFIEQQIARLYSPLVSVRREILAKRELGTRIDIETTAAWKGLTEYASPDLSVTIEEARSAALAKVAEYNSKQLVGELLPAYRRMLQLLRDNFWLAEQSTRAQHGALIDFVEIWDRWLGGTLPPEIGERLQHSEKPLEPFYEDIEERLEALRSKLSGSTG